MRHRGRQLPYDRERKIRTREHVLADLSYTQLFAVLQRLGFTEQVRSSDAGQRSRVYVYVYVYESPR